jgi:hypothetical protein
MSIVNELSDDWSQPDRPSKRIAKCPSITLCELQSGSRPLITEREFAYLRGCSQSTLQKERGSGKGAPFLKDLQTGRIFYSAEDVVAFLGRTLHCRSTSEYDTRTHQERLTKARSALGRRRSS